MALRFAVLAACLVAAWAQQQQVQRTTPVPILKQINRQNEDGSYSYGYESADGTFKIETKYPTGEVYGKYGYVDADGKVRTVEYGASKKGGFNPAGTDINVPPPTLVNNNNLADSDYDDGSYREDPSIYYKNDPNSAPAAPVQQAKPLKARFNNAPVTQAPAFRTQQQQFSSSKPPDRA
ncbi:pupal cuticle protein 27 [Bemisia tabaci]|uniref:pupal cuticle protein 27 n=1 Tax=Bemisia tabaci TaxID=7038 RepID=UPI003B282060